MAHQILREGHAVAGVSTNANGFTIDGGQGTARINGILTDLDTVFLGGNEIIVPSNTTIEPLGSSYVVYDDGNPTDADHAFLGEESTLLRSTGLFRIAGGYGTATIARTSTIDGTPTSPVISVNLAEIEHGFLFPSGTTLTTGNGSWISYDTTFIGTAPTPAMFDKELPLTISGTVTTEATFHGGKGTVRVDQYDSDGDLLDTFKIRLRGKNEFAIANRFAGTGTAARTVITPLGSSFIVRT